MTRIAVLRANAIGDFIMTLPALDALRAAYPDAEIVLLGRAWHREFLANRPSPVDRVVVVPEYGGVTAPQGVEGDSAEIEAFFNRMRAERFDLALQLHGGGRNSNPFLLRLGAALTAGTRTPDAPPLDRWIQYGRWQHEVVRWLEVVSLVGARPVGIEPRLAVTATDRAESLAVVPDDGRPLAAIHPGGTDPERWWPSERFAAVGDALARAGAHVVIVGTKEESEQIRRVLSHMTSKATDLCCRLSLRGLYGLLSRCRVIVANDSGPIHLAEAAGTPTAGIYSYFNLMTYGPLTRAHHRPSVSWRREPGSCDGACGACEECTSYLTDVPVDAVRDAALELLVEGKSQ